MSSIIVRGMRIPENCSECMRSDLRTTIKCVEWTEISAGRRENERAWSCPLIDLGKHGRLIDADKLMDDIKKNSASYFADDFAREWVDVQPTVIEAEEEV